MAASAPIVGSAVNASRSGSGASRSSGTGSPGAGSSQAGSGGSGSAASGSRGSSSRGGGGSSASSAKAYKAEKRRRTCKKCPKWRYEMGIRKLGGVPYIYQWHHLFVVAWNRGGTGAMPTFSAFPSNEHGSPAMGGVVSGLFTSDSSKEAEEGHTPDPADTSDFGYIKAHFAADYYTSGELNPGNRFVTLKDTSKDLTPKLTTSAMTIDAKKIKYEATGPNSNSFAMSVAENSGLPRKKPSGDAPGSGMKL